MILIPDIILDLFIKKELSIFMILHSDIQVIQLYFIQELLFGRG